ncbi:MAG: alcohol dehydrogenase catalytic domain-containing protein [Sphingobacteriales bacterium]|nr:MAG: alcohol dehydrogenase catalytic domain-containing protein [Sphingobacteriales bacterium]
MNALVFKGIQQIDYTTSAPEPKILEDTDVIVQVKVAAVCGSDLHVYHGRETGLDIGTVMGHEFVGQVVDTGKQVRRLSAGDWVVSPFTTNCGHCYYCQIGLTCRCTQGQLYGWVQNGEGLHGGQAAFVRVPLAESTLLAFDSSQIPPEAALLAGDVRATGYYCAVQANIQPDGVYAVIGCGPVGLMAVLAAKELGANTVYALDTVPERLNIAQSFNAIPVHTGLQHADELIKEATKGRGADAVMEAVGSPGAMRLAYQLLRPGGIISSVGVHTTERFSFSPIEAYDKNVTFKIGRAPARYFMPQLLAAQTPSAYRATDIITHRFSLNQGAEAYRIFDTKADGCIKAVLTV